MANRRISELQEIAGIDLAEADLFTVVQVAEADPAIKNKKLTISGTKAYLDIFYLPRTGGTVSGSVTIQENLTVSGLSTLSSGLNVTQTGNIDTLFVSGDATITGTTSGTTFTGTTINATNITANQLTATSFSINTLSGISGVFTDTVIATTGTITGATGAFTRVVGQSGFVSNTLRVGTITGDFGAFGTATGVNILGTTQVSGATVTGQEAEFTSGTFQTLVTDGFTTQGDLTVSGTFIAEGSGFFSSGVNITGTLSGTTVTGTNAQFTNVTGVNVIGTTQVSGATVTGGLARFTTLTGGTAGFTTVTGTTSLVYRQLYFDQCDYR